jgi:hypothetical protein
MERLPPTSWLLEQEARALLTRLDRVKPFALQMTSVLAAAVTPGAQTAIEQYLAQGRRVLREMIHRFLCWLRHPLGRAATPAQAQGRFTLLRLRFNTILAQFDIFADALVQRSEHDHGIWLAGARDRGRRPVIVTDGFCPGCGRLAPLRDYLTCAQAADG